MSNFTFCWKIVSWITVRNYHICSNGYFFRLLTIFSNYVYCHVFWYFAPFCLLKHSQSIDIWTHFVYSNIPKVLIFGLILSTQTFPNYWYFAPFCLLTHSQSIDILPHFVYSHIPKVLIFCPILSTHTFPKYWYFAPFCLLTHSQWDGVDKMRRKKSISSFHLWYKETYLKTARSFFVKKKNKRNLSSRHLWYKVIIS